MTLVDPWVPAVMPVAAIARETLDTVTLTLDAGASTLPFAPGQFNMLTVFGHGEVPISISGDPERPERLAHTIRGVGKVTSPMLALGVGDEVGVRGPYGSAWPVQEAEGDDVVIVAGGIGLAPLRPAVYHILANRRRYGRVFLLYGARTPDDMLFVDELHRWRGRFDFEVEVTVDRGPIDWRAAVGVVTRLVDRAPFDPDDAVVFTCGPEVMMRFVAQEALHQGVPPHRIWLSMERNMHCAIGLCGHCQWGNQLVCRDGPVFRFDHVNRLFEHQEL